MTSCMSFNNSACNRVLNPFEVDYMRCWEAVVKRITVIKFGLNGESGTGTKCYVI